MFKINNTYTKNVSSIVAQLDTPNSLTVSSPSKISKKSNSSFSILAGPKYGCPGATKSCMDCYAMKGNHHLPNVQIALAKNWLLVKRMERNRANKKIVDLLNEIIPASAKIFRIHESGDFMSQWYLNSWTKVIRIRRDVSFWTYTRSFDLDFQHILRQPNFVLWASVDEHNRIGAGNFINRYKSKNVKKAYGPLSHNEKIPKSTVVCPATSGKLNINGACERCMLCVVKNNTHKNIAFLKH